MNLGDWATWTGAGVSLLGAVTAWLLARNSLRLTRQANQLAYFSALRDWANEVVAANQTAIHLCLLDPSHTQNPSFFERRHELLCRLLILLDRGRWFFPNVRQDEYGQHKEIAFRGYRHRILDDVAAARFLVKKLDYLEPFSKTSPIVEPPGTGEETARQNTPWRTVPKTDFVVPWLKQELTAAWTGHPNTRIRGYLIAVERNFASEIQELLNPASWLGEFQLLTKRDGSELGTAADRPRE
jgi:hypothetical protein